MNEVPTVGIVIVEDGKVLLVQKKKHQGRGWQVPGGEIEQDETVKQAAVRELLETTGLHTTEDNLRVLEKTWRATVRRLGGMERKYSLRVLVCGNYEGTVKETEMAIPKWTPLSDLPSLALAPNTQAIIQAAQA